MTKKILDKGKEVYGRVKRRITPAFLVMVALSFIFWYSGKLQYTYTAEMPVTVEIEGERVRTTCVVEGTGHNIISARYFKRKTIKLQRSEVELLPIDGVSNTYEISPTSLQNIISVRNSSLKVLSVSRMPFVMLEDF
ncbi:MAG: hypothetical protein IKY63_01510 [Tidjanibacter sp.]|nr:hypothetical protein [Tidjanibacter sp.]